MPEQVNVIAAKRRRDDEAARLAEAQHAREEEQRQEAERAKFASELERLRDAGFTLFQEINGRGLWRHPAYVEFREGKQVIRDAEGQMEGVVDASFADVGWDHSQLKLAA